MSLLRERMAKLGLDKKKLADSSEEAPMTANRADTILARKTTSGVDRVQHGRPLESVLKTGLTMPDDSTRLKETIKPLTSEDKPKSNPLLDKLRAKKEKAEEPEFKVETKSLRQPILSEPKPSPIQAKPKESLAEKMARIKREKAGAEAAQNDRIANKKAAVANAMAQVNKPATGAQALLQRARNNPKPAPTIVQPSEGYEAMQPKEELPSPKPAKMSMLDKIKAKKAAEATPDTRMDMTKPLEEDSKFQPTLHKEGDTLFIKPTETSVEVEAEKPMSALERLKAKKAKKPEVIAATPKIEIVKEEEAAPKEAASEALEGEFIQADNRAMVDLNEKQRFAVERAVAGESMCLVGPAGTGKTTGVRGLMKALRNEGKITQTTEFKRQGGNGLEDRVKEQWSVACVAFTRTAANNLRGAITADPELEDFYYCCQTIHNLLEYFPEHDEIWDEELGGYRKTMRFVPARDEHNKIDIDVLIIEEGSMVDLMLAEKLMLALPSKCQIVYLGDINQLPPVFGLPILAYALHKLKVVELTHVYRQAIGPVLNAAHNILNGIMPEEGSTDRGSLTLYHDFKTDAGKVSIKSHSKDVGTPVQVGQDNCARTYSKMFEMFYGRGDYDPKQDMVLVPWNKRELGTIALNATIAQFIGDARNAVVHEIIAGFRKHYLAEGDMVLVDKQPGVIKSIGFNTDYMGKAPMAAGNSLSRFGARIMGRDDVDIDLDAPADDYGSFDLDKMAEENASEIKKAASHIVTVALESGEEAVLSSAGDYSEDKFSLGYVLTTHKAQGMEFRKVWVIVHTGHGATVTREWLYTAVTRTKQDCTIIAHEGTLKKALARQRIEGSTIAEKIENFTGAVDNLEEIRVVPNSRA